MTGNLESNLRLEKEYVDRKKKTLREFWDLPVISAVRIKTGEEDYFKHLDWEQHDEKTILPKLESIKVRKILYDKPICIIYNPNSGSKTNVAPTIQSTLELHHVPYELMPTQKSLDGFRFANEIPLQNYSALIAVGGDGSISEVVNGMLARSDGQTLPVGFIPNGSTNWHGVMVGTFTVEMALDAICNRTVS